MRLDVFLFRCGLCRSRTEAADRIRAGDVSCLGKVICKPSFEIDDSTPVEQIILSDKKNLYVSRGGLKLAHALHVFGVPVTGRRGLDIGASTGGFTDCLLRMGALQVCAVDSGSGQLADALRTDARVCCMERCNARYLKADDLPFTPDFVVMDVSFISQTLIFPALSGILPSGADLITLIKPQFELQRSLLGKGGIVRSEQARRQATERVLKAARACGFYNIALTDSPITGGDGNHEYLAHFIRQEETAPHEDHCPDLQ